MAVIVRAYAKINWGLDITGRRADGYHLLDMVMQTIDLSDELVIEPAAALSLTVDGVPAGEDNLVLRAARALNRRTGRGDGARMALAKRIPARAGLGGGSADCAAALTALNRLWGLGLGLGELAEVGLSLGADVPFCLAGGLARVSGIGERIEPVPDAPEIPLALVVPGGGLSTGEVFARWDRGYPGVGLDSRMLAEAVAAGDLTGAARLAVNALSAPAMSLLPQIGELIERMRSLGAAAAFMTGSGSAVVGAFKTPSQARRAAAEIPGAILSRTLSGLPEMA